MRMARQPTTVLAASVIILGALAGCDADSAGQHNPASGRVASLAGLPLESDSPPGGVAPNPAPFVDAGRLAAADAEAGNVKTASRTYMAVHPYAARLTSDDLQPGYLSGSLQARYYVSPATFRIIRVDAVGAGWQGIVFSLSQQKWVKGAPDSDHPGDQDIP